MFEKSKRKRKWGKIIKTTDGLSFKSSLRILEASLEELLNEAFNYMFIPEVERICFELIETIADLKLMQETDSVDEYNMAKHRVVYMINNRMESWYF